MRVFRAAVCGVLVCVAGGWVAGRESCHGAGVPVPPHDGGAIAPPGRAVPPRRVADARGIADRRRIAQAGGDERRAAIIRTAQASLHIREATGKNDGPEVEAILDAVGLRGTGAPWCAAYVVWVGDTALGRAGNPYPRSAWSPDMVRAPTWTLAGGGLTPQPGDTFGVWFRSKGRVAHTGLVGSWGSRYTETYEGNTSPDAAPGSAADRDGGGAHRKRRLVGQIHSARDWLGR